MEEWLISTTCTNKGLHSWSKTGR